ncbi:ankyrin repeat domain-containing protein [Paenibacillus sediminis]|uniref:Ankyrin repeat protein n=1 Tax=Paenibacillus sediminis TaxID=664909 RepID=A0ABS4H6I8_9BACL|nr:ankyrin repeat domain-containing protein [Paenibacillus sediminis]MBP1938096.1 ankyrin repeat protein [Paenibacillus sediminis]
MYNEKNILLTEEQELEYTALLLSYKPDFKALDNGNIDLTINYPIVKSKVKVVEKLLKAGANVNQLGDVHTRPALIAIAESRDLDVKTRLELTQLVLKYKGDPNASYICPCGDTWTPLEKASMRIVVGYAEDGTPIMNYPDIEIVEALLKAGASPKNDYSLYYSVRANNYEMSEMLLKAGANPNQTGKVAPNNQMTVLQFATENNNKKLVKLLRKYGASN